VLRNRIMMPEARIQRFFFRFLAGITNCAMNCTHTTNVDRSTSLLQNTTPRRQLTPTAHICQNGVSNHSIYLLPRPIASSAHEAASFPLKARRFWCFECRLCCRPLLLHQQLTYDSRVRTKTVKKSAKVVIERYYPRLTLGKSCQNPAKPFHY
jgi:hypothetical protein